METKDTLIDERFNHRHAAGVTRFRVDRRHRDAGYYECVAVRRIEGTHHFLGCVNVFSRAEIEAAIAAERAIPGVVERMINNGSIGTGTFESNK